MPTAMSIADGLVDENQSFLVSSRPVIWSTTPIVRRSLPPVQDARLPWMRSGT